MSDWSIDTGKSVTRPISAEERGDMTTKHYNGNGGYGVEDWLEMGLSMANGAYNIASAQESKATQASWRREDQAREDSVLQRAKADALKAGFSPLAALSSNIGSSASPIPVDTRSSVNSPLSEIANRKYLREQLSMQRQLAESQIANTAADTRDKNASADVNEATTAVQVLKAKAELDAMIANNNITEAQIVKYLNDMKSEGISDTVIDSLLAQFGATPNTPTISSSDLSGNKTIAGEQALTVAQTNLADANKLLANAQESLAKANTTSVTNSNNYWTETKKDVQKSIDLAEQTIANYRKKVTDDRELNTSVPIVTSTGTTRWMTLDNALDYIDVGIKDAQRKMAESNLGSSELKDYLSVLGVLLDGLSSVGNILGGIKK